VRGRTENRKFSVPLGPPCRLRTLQEKWHPGRNEPSSLRPGICRQLEKRHLREFYRVWSFSSEFPDGHGFQRVVLPRRKRGDVHKSSETSILSVLLLFSRNLVKRYVCVLNPFCLKLGCPP
jgi:hypothetical protein